MIGMTRVFLCVFCAAVATWQYVTITLATCSDCLYATEHIAAGDFVAPFVHRPLTPQIIVALGNTNEAHAQFHFVLLTLFFLAFWRWCDHLGANGSTAVAMTTIGLMVMYPTYWFSTYAVTEWLLWLTGLLLLTERSSSLQHSTGRLRRSFLSHLGLRSRRRDGVGRSHSRVWRW